MKARRKFKCSAGTLPNPGQHAGSPTEPRCPQCRRSLSHNMSHILPNSTVPGGANTQRDASHMQNESTCTPYGHPKARKVSKKFCATSLRLLQTPQNIGLRDPEKATADLGFSNAAGHRFRARVRTLASSGCNSPDIPPQGRKENELLSLWSNMDTVCMWLL